MGISSTAHLSKIKTTKVSFYINDDNLVHEFETHDLAGVIAAVKESDRVMFGREFIGKYEYMILNHYYANENNPEEGYTQELVVYFK